MAQILGYNKFISKQGNPCYVVTVAKPYTQAQKDRNECVGSQAETIFIDSAMYASLKPDMVGKECKPEYEVNGKYATCVDLNVKA